MSKSCWYAQNFNLSFPLSILILSFFHSFPLPFFSLHSLSISFCLLTLPYLTRERKKASRFPSPFSQYIHPWFIPFAHLLLSFHLFTHFTFTWPLERQKERSTGFPSFCTQSVWHQLFLTTFLTTFSFSPYFSTFPSFSHQFTSHAHELFLINLQNRETLETSPHWTIPCTSLHSCDVMEYLFKVDGGGGWIKMGWMERKVRRREERKSCHGNERKLRGTTCNVFAHSPPVVIATYGHEKTDPSRPAIPI